MFLFNFFFLIFLFLVSSTIVREMEKLSSYVVATFLIVFGMWEQSIVVKLLLTSEPLTILEKIVSIWLGLIFIWCFFQFYEEHISLYVDKIKKYIFVKKS